MDITQTHRCFLPIGGQNYAHQNRFVFRISVFSRSNTKEFELRLFSSINGLLLHYSNTYHESYIYVFKRNPHSDKSNHLRLTGNRLSTASASCTRVLTRMMLIQYLHICSRKKELERMNTTYLLKPSKHAKD